jgi:hypothetical protein
MAVSVTELESLDMPRAGVDRVADEHVARVHAFPVAWV